MVDSVNENAIEFLKNDKIATVTFSSQKFVNRIKKLAKSSPAKFKIMCENDDGSIVAHIPVSSIHINMRESSMSDEDREKASQRMREYHERKKDEEDAGSKPIKGKGK